MDVPSELAEDFSWSVEWAKGLATIYLARKIYLKEVNPAKLTSATRLREVFQTIGKDAYSAVEIHVTRVPNFFSAIRQCVSIEEYESAVVLLFTCVEGEVNVMCQILLRIRGYSRNEISETIQGTDFKTKLHVLLPLLGIEVSPRVKQYSRAAQIIRNQVVHFKGTPSSHHDSADEVGDFEKIKKMAKQFFSQNPLQRLEADTSELAESVSMSPEIQRAARILHKFGFN